jgi:hypothetical protein
MAHEVLPQFLDVRFDHFMTTTLQRKKRLTGCVHYECKDRTSNMTAMIKYFSTLREGGVINDEQYYELSKYIASIVVQREVECIVQEKLDEAISQKFSPHKLLEALALA